VRSRLPLAWHEQRTVLGFAFARSARSSHRLIDTAVDLTPEKLLEHACRLPGTISGSCSALVEPGPSAAIHCTIKLRRTPRLYGDRRGILADPISGTAVLEYGATEILPPVGAIL
jgi:hypothetical protein